MSIKTAYNGYNEDDFAEENGQLKELTVTITLCEYRNLIQERTYDEKHIEQLIDENKKLKEAYESLTKCLFKNKSISEPIISSIKNVADALTGVQKGATE